MENIFSVVGRVVYFASADVQRVISNGWPLLDVSAQIEICGDIFLYCNDQDLNVEIALIEFIAITTGLMRYMVIVLLDGPARCRLHF